MIKNGAKKIFTESQKAVIFRQVFDSHENFRCNFRRL